MMARCYNAKNKMYSCYGGRGITVCERWHDFKQFAQDVGERPEGKTLDRIDNNGPYCPENVRWATRREQQRNMRSNRILTLNGVSKPAIAWSEELGVPLPRIYHRLKLGWSDEDVLMKPLKKAFVQVASVRAPQPWLGPNWKKQ